MSNTITTNTSRSRELEERAVRRFWEDRATGASCKVLIGATLALADLGYHGASTRQIADRAGMSPAAVYIHFESKEDLFHRIALVGHQSSTGAFLEPAATSAHPVQQLRLAIASFATWNAENTLLSRSVEYEMRHHRTERFADVWEMRRAVETTTLDILALGVERRVFSIGDVEWTKILLISICVDIARWYRPGSARTPAMIGFQYADLALKLAGTS